MPSRSQARLSTISAFPAIMERCPGNAPGGSPMRTVLAIMPTCTRASGARPGNLGLLRQTRIIVAARTAKTSALANSSVRMSMRMA